MGGFSFSAFAGVIPRLSSRLLDQRNAEKADNLKAFSGELRSWKRPLKVAATTKIAGEVKTIFRLSDGNIDYWLNWLTDVDVALGPLSVDPSQRFYFTGDGSPKKSNLAMATSGSDYPTAAYEMGLPVPAALTATVSTAGSGVASSRTYLLTFYNVWDEEGPPSAVSASQTWNTSGFSIALSAIDTGFKACTIVSAGGVATVTLSAHGYYNGSKVTHSGATQPEYNVTAAITVIDADTYSYPIAGTPASPATGSPKAMGNYGLAGRRIYRSNVTSSGVTVYQLVADIPNLTASTFTDTVLDKDLGVAIPTTIIGETGADWLQPPEGLRGLIQMENGIYVGFVGKSVCFSEPNNPHAWPIRYQQTFTSDVIGIRSFGTTVVVGTKGQPGTLTGTHPENMSPAGVEDFRQACASKRSMADGPGGVFYVSANGLVLGGLSGFAVLSTPYFDRDKWQEQVFPDSIIGVVYDDRYYGFFQSGPNQGMGFIMPKEGDAPGVLFHTQYASAAYVDRESGKLYIVQNGVILEWDADDNNLLPFAWLSKLVVTPEPVNFGAYVIDADFTQLDDQAAEDGAAADDLAFNLAVLATGITNGELNAAALNEYDLNGSILRGGSTPSFDNRYLLFQAFAQVADGEAGPTIKEFEKLITTKAQGRMESGFKSDTWQFGLTGNIPVFSLKVAETPKGLKNL